MILRFITTFLVIICFTTAASTNRAILIGIGNYNTEKTGWNIIHGDKDVELLKPLLEKQGFSDIVSLKDKQAIKENIINALTSLISRCQPGDRVYFHFSGHGQPIRDDNHDEVKDKLYDESIIPYDACRDHRKMGGKYVGQYHLIDDEFSPLLNAIKCKLGSNGELFVVIDACYSKGIQKDEITDMDPELLRYIRGTNHAFTPPGHSSYLAKIPKPNRFTPGAKMTILTACQSNERNFEYKAPDGRIYGSLSYFIYSLLQKDSDFNRWRKVFQNNQYKSLKIFPPIQHPTMEVYE